MRNIRCQPTFQLVADTARSRSFPRAAWARKTGAMVVKLMRGDEYRDFVASGVYSGSTDDRRDGFIHLSTADQWPATRERYFADAAELWLVECDGLGDALRWEVSRGGARFPHLYRALLASDVTAARRL